MRDTKKLEDIFDTERPGMFGVKNYTKVLTTF